MARELGGVTVRGNHELEVSADDGEYCQHIRDKGDEFEQVYF